MKRYTVPVLLLLVVVAPCAYLFYRYDLWLYLTDEEKAIRFVTSFGPWSVLVFIFLQVLQVIVAPIPGDVTGFMGGYLYGTVLGTAYSTVGLTLGSWLAFYVGRLYGLPLVEKIIRPDIIRKYDYFMEHKGRAISFAFFLIPGFPKDSLCYLIGLSHMKAGVFLIISTSGRLLGTVLLSVAGSSLRNHHNGPLAASIGVIVLMIVLAYIYRGRLQSLLKKMHRPQR